MTSNGDPALNASSLPVVKPSNLPRRTPSPRPAAPKAASPSSKENRPLPQNGHHDHDHDHDDAQNESEAETVVLGRGDDSPEKKVIKTERTDNDAARLRSIEEESRAHSPVTNGRRRSSNSKDVKSNGTKHGSERDAKSPVPTSPSSRTTSRHTKDTSPTDSNKSPVQSAVSPTQTTGRGRSASTVENRKRKLRDDSFPQSAEPPRQKAKTEGLRESRQPHSPATPGFGRPHKRSQSTQSTVTGVAGRKRRETTSLALTVEPTRWPSDGDSDDSSSPPAYTPNLMQHTRLKRSSHRALTSPARTLIKPKVDRFGATRLAKECEKGELDAVKEAFEEAPDELDSVDYAGIAPLQKASLHGWVDVARFLISKGCDTACESGNGDTPLIDAVANSHLDVIKVLLDEGHVNPHHSNKKGERAIDVLDNEDDDAEEIEKVLREAMRKETNTSRSDKQPQRRQGKTASRLLYNEFNVETLIEKAGNGDSIAVGELLASNIKPNITCGVAAARGGHWDILSVLLASGLKADFDPSKHPDTPMTVAIGRGHLNIIELLLEQDDFDPTRRNKENKTYYELAEEKAGPSWETERDILKRAYDERKGLHRSPRRQKKEVPNPSANRPSRNSLPKRDRSSSPQRDSKRASLTKSTTAPQKSRRLMSGKEMASREGKRRKRVVDDETSEDESEEDVRPPTRKAKPRSYSLGEANKPVKEPLKARSDDNDTTKRKGPAPSDSEHDHGSKPQQKIRTKVEPSARTKATPEVQSPDERKPVKNKIKYKTMEDKIKKRKLSDASTDGASIKRMPTDSAKSTPAPPERTATPEAVRERRQEEQRLEIEARRKAAEAAAEAERLKKEQEEAARKAAEEAEAERKAAAEAEAQRQAEEAEAARKREEEEMQRRAEEEAKRQEMLMARQDRISKLPRALRRACIMGHDRPLHFSGDELGISAVFLPLYYTSSQEIHAGEAPGKTYVCSFQLVGILGLPELDLAHLDSPYCDWPRIPVSHKQRESILRQIDIDRLAQEYRFPMEFTPGYDYGKIQESIKEARTQFLAMDGLYWVEESLLRDEMDKVEQLKPLLEDIKPGCGKRRVALTDIDESEKDKPKKTFMDLIMAQNGVNGVHVNGDAG
ncbi:hypothetical protein BKA63DRAFT_518452 [Paraphoma chrysanthemicola]|nr:hypothetical protein BKA63DRAFT_518452 [Paraphoma chrysanthemicola]